MKRIVVLVSGGGTNLQALLDAEARGEIKNGKITCVISSSANAYALERAKNHGIKAKVVAKKGCDRITFTNRLIEAIEEEQADLIVMAGFLIITDASLTRKYENRIINVHPALIPAFSGDGFYGLHVHEQALKKGVKLTGATIHFVNEVCDGGPIILQGAAPVLEGDTPETLQRRVMETVEWVLLPQAVSLFCEDRLTVTDNIVHILPEGKE